jgi:hypothetical protein
MEDSSCATGAIESGINSSKISARSSKVATLKVNSKKSKKSTFSQSFRQPLKGLTKILNS